MAVLSPPLIELDPRLQAVADLVQGPRLADIGTDHGYLPLALLQQGRVQRVIAVEKANAPAALAQRTLEPWSGRAEVRLGDGFEVLAPGEVDCATVCGMGGWLIVSLLSRAAGALPPRLVLQANRDTPLLRVWAQTAGYHLQAERMVSGHWNFVILALQQAEGPDPAYQGLPLPLAQEFGPHLLRQRHPLLCREVEERELYFRGTRAVGVHGLLCQAKAYLEL